MEAVALDRALEALADRDAGDLHFLARLEGLHGHGLAGGELVRAADLDELAVRADVVLLQMPELRLGELLFGDLVEGELDSVVPVHIRKAHGHDRAGPGLDDRHGGERAGLLVEDLRHAQLLSDDAFHQRAPSEQVTFSGREKQAPQGRRARS
jgi:hypothetical protein